MEKSYDFTDICLEVETRLKSRDDLVREYPNCVMVLIVCEALRSLITQALKQKSVVISLIMKNLEKVVEVISNIITNSKDAIINCCKDMESYLKQRGADYRVDYFITNPSCGEVVKIVEEIVVEIRKILSKE